MMDGQFVGLGQARARLGVGRATIYRWVWSGILPAVKIGGRWRIPLAALENDALRMILRGGV
jgi:excisionase family DNA binding protein